MLSKVIQASRFIHEKTHSQATKQQRTGVKHCSDHETQTPGILHFINNISQLMLETTQGWVNYDITFHFPLKTFITLPTNGEAACIKKTKFQNKTEMSHKQNNPPPKTSHSWAFLQVSVVVPQLIDRILNVPSMLSYSRDQWDFIWGILLRTAEELTDH